MAAVSRCNTGWKPSNKDGCCKQGVSIDIGYRECLLAGEASVQSSLYLIVMHKLLSAPCSSLISCQCEKKLLRIYRN